MKNNMTCVSFSVSGFGEDLVEYRSHLIEYFIDSANLYV